MKIPKYADLPTGTINGNALKQVNESMNQNKCKIWNSVKLHELYMVMDGKLTRREMFTKLSDYIGKDFEVIRVDGCAALVGFRETTAKKS